MRTHLSLFIMELNLFSFPTYEAWRWAYSLQKTAENVDKNIGEMHENILMKKSMIAFLIKNKTYVLDVWNIFQSQVWYQTLCNIAREPHPYCLKHPFIKNFF